MLFPAMAQKIKDTNPYICTSKIEHLSLNCCKSNFYMKFKFCNIFILALQTKYNLSANFKYIKTLFHFYIVISACKISHTYLKIFIYRSVHIPAYETIE